MTWPPPSAQIQSIYRYFSKSMTVTVTLLADPLKTPAPFTSKYLPLPSERIRKDRV